MARTLKDVYIKVTEKNRKELERITKHSLTKNTYLEFIVDDTLPLEDTEEPKYKQKVSLSELKRLIDTIPTREEITRLKKRSNTYKQCFYNAKKENQSLTLENESLLNSISNLNSIHNEYVSESGKKQKLLQNLYDNALKENDDLKLSNEKSLKKIYDLEKKLKHVVDKNELQGDLIEEKNFKISDLEKIKEDFADVIIYRNKEIAKLSEEIEQLKNKKWYQIWK